MTKCTLSHCSKKADEGWPGGGIEQYFPWTANPPRKRPQAFWVQIPWRSGQHGLQNSWFVSCQLGIQAIVSVVSFSGGWGTGWAARQMEPIQPRPLVFEVWVMPEIGQSPGSRFLCLGLRTHTVRTKGASFCFKAPAARPPHRNISATATLDLFPFFSRTDRRVKHSGPRPVPPPGPRSLHTHSSQAPPPSSGWALDS